MLFLKGFSVFIAKIYWNNNSIKCGKMSGKTGKI